MASKTDNADYFDTLMNMFEVIKPKTKVRHVPTIKQFHNGMRYIQCGDIQISAESGYRTPADMPDEIINAIEEYNQKRK